MSFEDQKENQKSFWHFQPIRFPVQRTKLNFFLLTDTPKVENCPLMSWLTKTSLYFCRNLGTKSLLLGILSNFDRSGVRCEEFQPRQYVIERASMSEKTGTLAEEIPLVSWQKVTLIIEKKIKQILHLVWLSTG